MKQWMRKLIDQFGMDWNSDSGKTAGDIGLNEDRATVLYLIDTYGKYLIDLENQPVRKVRETFDDFAKGILQSDGPSSEKLMFRFRQFFSSYRIDEYTYIQNTFDDFKNVIWDFADQLSEDLKVEQSFDLEVKKSLEMLREAVEANSIDDLRTRSREFIDFYVAHQTNREARRNRRVDAIQKNLAAIRQKLSEATQSANTDHLTGAFNRRKFDEKIRELITNFKDKQTHACMIMLDIDYFKRINDVFGHDVGDFVLKECVRILKEVFKRDKDFVARVGGEEFAILLPNMRIPDATIKAEEALERIRKEVIVHDGKQIRFTASMGLAEIVEEESRDEWIKRSDQALYASKKTGRDKLTIAGRTEKIGIVA